MYRSDLIDVGTKVYFKDGGKVRKGIIDGVFGNFKNFGGEDIYNNFEYRIKYHIWQESYSNNQKRVERYARVNPRKTYTTLTNLIRQTFTQEVREEL